jgi:hypothetical protein
MFPNAARLGSADGSRPALRTCPATTLPDMSSDRSALGGTLRVPALRKNGAMRSPQTLSEGDRRIVAAWAADCAERVLGLFEAEAPGDSRPRDAIARTRAFARGELSVAEEIRRRFAGADAASEVKTPQALAAARAAGQAAAVPHMGAHALGAAAYAAKAVALAAPERPDAVADELRWQLDAMSGPVRAALCRLPPVGENRAGPLGPGLLASGVLGTIIRDLQAGLGTLTTPPNRPSTRPRVHESGWGNADEF